MVIHQSDLKEGGRADGELLAPFRQPRRTYPLPCLLKLAAQCPITPAGEARGLLLGPFQARNLARYSSQRSLKVLFIPVIGLLINLRALDSSSSSLRGRNEGLTERFFSPGGFSLLGVSRLRSAELRYVLLQGPLDDQLDLFVELCFLLVLRHPGFESGGNTAGVAKTRGITAPFARSGPYRTL